MAQQQWDERSFFDELRRKKGDTACAVARRILGWCARQGYDVEYGLGGALDEEALARLSELDEKARARPALVLPEFGPDRRSNEGSPAAAVGAAGPTLR